MVTSADPIHFRLTLCTISAENGIYSFMESSTVEMGLLDQHTMFLSAADHGRTKDIYRVSYMTFIFLSSPLLKEIFQMIIQGKQFVAKKLMDTGNGRGHVPLLEAVQLLSADLVQLR